MRKYLIGAVVGLTVGVIIAAATPRADQEETYEYLDLFAVIFEQIRSGYVEEVDEAELIKSAIHGMFLSLDPHSTYLEPEGYQEVRERTSGAFGGLGIEVTQEDGWVKVVSPIDDTPAARAGLQSGDFITHVDGESLFGLTLQEAVDLLRGEIDSEVVLTIAREGEDPFDVPIIRAEIKTTAVRHRIIDDIGYIRISNFSERVGTDLESAFDSLREEAGDAPLLGFVLDLRNNPGGLLNEAVKVSDAFLERGEIVTIRGREQSEIQRHSASAGDLAEGLPVVVLINSGSASASEIVAGALRDHSRAVIVGTRSFGKGSVQNIHTLDPRGAIRLTVARYYTPSGQSIQGLGVEPHVHIRFVLPPPEEEEEEEESSLRRPGVENDLRGSLDGGLSEEERQQVEEEAEQRARAAETLRRDDNQLAYAVDLIRGISLHDLAPGR